MHRALRFALLPLATGLATTVILASSLLAPAGASAGPVREGRLLIKINNVRADHGLAPLRTDPALAQYARAHARSMGAQGTLFHTPDFAVICCWSAMAENIGMGYTVRGLHHEFMGSAPHRANILNPLLTEVGLGVVRVNGALWVTEVFRRR
jgi:uncharacterized protein YkwD